MLTQKQRDLLLFINEKMSESDIPPSFEEMKEALGLKSKSGVHRLITGLVERGYIKRLPHRARALEIKRLPQGLRSTDSNVRHDPEDLIDSKDTQIISFPLLPVTQSSSQIQEIPFLGKIAAGTPIEAIRDEGRSISLPSGYLGRGDYYALSIEGDSMINAGIFDKDTVIIKRVDTAESGTIVVALVDDQEVTLKRLRKAGNKIVLEPENDRYEPRVLEPDRVKIQGRLASLMRNYS